MNGQEKNGQEKNDKTQQKNEFQEIKVKRAFIWVDKEWIQLNLRMK